MNDDLLHEPDCLAANRRWLWLAIVVVGVVFFYFVHNFQVSRYEQFAPWSDAEGTVQASHNVVKGLALSLVGVLGAYLIVRPDGRPLKLTGWLPALIGFYLAWSLASVLWSIDPGTSCKRLAVLAFCVLAAVGFARQFQPRDVALMAMVIGAAYLFVGVGTEVALGTFHPWSPGYRFAGTVHPNTQGAHLGVLCLASFCLARSASRHQAWLWTLFAVGLIFLLLTKSRTSCAAFAMAFSTLSLLSVSGRTLAIVALLAALFVSTAALTAVLFGVDLDDKVAEAATLGRQEDLETLTGRLPLWMELLGYSEARPLQGYGYEAFWTDKNIETISDEVQWPVRQAHNTYVDGILSAGLIGAGAFLAAVLLSLRRAAVAYRKTSDPGFAFTFGMIVLSIVGGCLETGMMGPSFPTLMTGCGIVQLLALP